MKYDRSTNLPGYRRRSGQKLWAALLVLLFTPGFLWHKPTAAEHAASESSPTAGPSAPDSGGPAGDNGAIAIPKKAEKPDVPLHRRSPR